MPKKVLFALWLSLACVPAYGFSLLGPYAPWMSVSNGFAQAGDLGGPMRLGHEYRWNIPMITYGFHPSFVQHFGSNGVRAVQAAIKVLNRLPPASQIRLEDFPLRTMRINQDASELGLRDLKSFVLSQLLYQLGLGPSGRHVWIIRNRTDNVDRPFLIAQRNYDTFSLMVTNAVNGIEYGYALWQISPGVSDAVELPLEPLGIFPFNAVTDRALDLGQFYTGLTRDDVGGLKYLYSRSNANMERLPGLVREADSGNLPRVNVVLRPGVEKLTFSKLTWNTAEGRFNPILQRFTLKYYHRGVLEMQNLQRFVTRPDILFDAKALPPTQVTSGTNVYYFPQMAKATTTARWINLGYLSGNAAAAGPGIITPGALIRITFDNSPPLPLNPFTRARWGSFDQSATSPILFPPSFADE